MLTNYNIHKSIAGYRNNSLANIASPLHPFALTIDNPRISPEINRSRIVRYASSLRSFVNPTQLVNPTCLEYAFQTGANPGRILTRPNRPPFVNPLGIPTRFVIDPFPFFFVRVLRSSVMNGVHQMAGIPVSAFP